MKRKMGVPVMSSGVWTWLGEWELARRRRLAEWLRYRVRRWPVRVVRFVFGGYVVLSLMVFTVLLMNGGRWETVPAVQHVTLPLKGGLRRVDDMSSFKREMDSIRANAVIQERLDSLMQARKGFADTMRQLEEYYK